MSINETPPTSKKLLWTGRVLTVLSGLFLLLDGVMKIMKPAPVVQGSVQLGFPESTMPGIGVALLACTILYLIPRTAVLGAILITGYLGGAVASQVRIHAGAFDVLFPVIFALIVWGGVYFQDGRLRALVPLRGGATK